MIDRPSADMANELQIHSPVLELYEPKLVEVAVGSDVALKIKLACPQGCELGSLPLVIEGADGRERASVPAANEAMREVTVKAPEVVGPHRWRLSFPAHEQNGVRHAACALTFTFETRPHATSLAVWAAPSPAVVGERFSIKVGAKSSGNRALAGRRIAVSDASGAVIGRGALQENPWPGTSALYWTQVDLPAPTQEGLAWYTADFAATDAATPHDGSTAKFSVAVVRPGEHRLSVGVFEKGTRTPIEDAQIRIGSYAAATDASGRAEVAVPKGSYELSVWKTGYDAPPRSLDISGDAGIEIEAEVVPPENPYAPWAE